MSIDYRALCAELVDELEDWIFCDDESEIDDAHLLIDRARAALAEPEPPADGEVETLARLLREENAEFTDGVSLGHLTSAERLRAADLLERLAESEPVGPTDEELNDTYWKAWHEHLDRTNSVLHAAGLRAVLARWGRPAITPIPVSERLPGPEDCDAEGCCWAIGGRGDWMRVYVIGRSWSNPVYTHWLPFHSLPLPEGGAA
jgi:hypothetical protein